MKISFLLKCFSYALVILCLTVLQWLRDLQDNQYSSLDLEGGGWWLWGFFFKLLLFKTTNFQKSVKLFCNSLHH